MKEYKMMDELIAHCTRCRLDLNHRVTLVMDGAPKRVLCLTCKGEHAYRRPPAEKTASAPSSTRKPRAHSAKAEQELEWKTKLAQGMTPLKSYAIDQKFDPEDRVKHPVFGVGLVVSFVAPDKVNVFFPENGIKLMKCG